MSSIGSRGDPNLNDPNDPMHYAPRSARNKATSPARPIHSVSSPSSFDEMLKEAVAKSRRHPLDPEVVYPPDRPRARLRLAGRVAAAIGVVAIIGFLFFSMIPKSQGSDPTSTKAANLSEDTQALLQKFVRFEKSQESKPDEPAQTKPDESQSLLQKFVQWQQKKQ